MANLENLSPNAAGLKFMGPAFWPWFETNKHHTWTFKFKVFGIGVSTSKKVEELKPLFERIFGPQPA
jgi:hypothetical protein